MRRVLQKHIGQATAIPKFIRWKLWAADFIETAYEAAAI